MFLEAEVSDENKQLFNRLIEEASEGLSIDAKASLVSSENP